MPEMITISGKASEACLSQESAIDVDALCISGLHTTGNYPGRLRMSAQLMSDMNRIIKGGEKL